ncbi:hypothetical protein LguiB_023100 [Lonicera macranthoides]
MVSNSSSVEDPSVAEQLIEALTKLLLPLSSVGELLDLLDEVENLLTKVEQGSPEPVKDALKPIMKALAADNLLKHTDMDVKISVAACISQIMRIAAPDSPYGDVEMKEYFQLTTIAFEKLSCLSGRCYTKAVSILETFAQFRTCILMLDLELNSLIFKMFEQFFNSVGSNLPPSVSLDMERTMTLVIEQSEELSAELLILLLTNVKLENKRAQPLAWKLGENVLKNCATTLKKCIPEAVKSMGIALGDFAEIVASICQLAFAKENLEVIELAPEAIDHGNTSTSKSVMNNGTAQNGNEDASKAESSLRTTESFHQSKQQGNGDTRNISQPENVGQEDRLPTEAMGKDTSQSKNLEGGSSTKTKCFHQSKKRKSQSENIDTSKGLKTELNPEVVPKKRDRKPSSLITPDEGYYLSWTSRGNKYLELSHFKSSSKKKVGNPPKISAVKGKSSVDRSEKETRNLSEEKNSRKKCLRKEENATNQNVSAHVSEGHDKASKKTHAVKDHGEKLVGREIKVWWPKDEEFYSGVITSYDKSNKRHQVLYIDGDKEILDLRKEHWELFEDGVIAGVKASVDTNDATGLVPHARKKCKVSTADDNEPTLAACKKISQKSKTAATVKHTNPSTPGSSKLIVPQSPTNKVATASTDITDVQGYKVKASIAPTLADIFSKYGNIVAQCPYKSAPVRASLLEVIGDIVLRLQSDDSVPDFEEVRRVVIDAEEAKLDVGWLRVHLEKRRVAEEAGKRGTELKEIKSSFVRAAKWAKRDLDHRKAVLAAAERSVREGERCLEALKCVKRKFHADILQNEAEKKKRSKQLEEFP